ncbi:methyltransferase [Saccharopolyspora lacisalsi]|uniref:Methyltransferase n=1 Tax=Halosaccharopolyspora lacisalsi TaxID=1000566 RepID=A0A839E396_9PSEU|nr:isoprenylcysteine carboxylmethyltransferase family protein [Halosaccharopolyspora lacisalsi]MBA8827520.1 methyltransferase [Halosaccharopolyspora lacisalsi]
MWWYFVVLAAVAAERVAELIVARSNETWTRGRSAVEYGRRHYPVMVVLHTGLLVGCLVEVAVAERPPLPVLAGSMLVLVVLAQVLRWWCIGTLGRYWNTRVLVVPGARPVRSGPYRLLRHPNYVAVVVEGAALPLVHSAWVTAVTFTLANAALLTVRIRCENAALTRAVPA